MQSVSGKEIESVLFDLDLSEFHGDEMNKQQQQNGFEEDKVEKSKIVVHSASCVFIYWHGNMWFCF